MIRETDPSIADDSQVEALLAFDDALATGADPSTSDWPASPLDAVHECQRLLEAVWPRSVPASVDLPRRFGRFSIVREVGRGGFGVVFLAIDPDLRRQVALKVPRPEVMAAASIRRRFLREAEAASRLDHPHIVPVYEVGEEGPVCYIASAYCDGPTLSDWLRRRTKPVAWTEAARLVAVLAAAVAHAHRRNILHRDLKPGNILLQPREASASGSEAATRPLEDYVPRICDFGLAKLLDEVSQETCSGLAIGSPPYMAPEQAAGRTREQGPATDVYALGVILYELLTGRPPLRGETDLETLRLVSDQDPPLPRVLRPGLPRDLETICLKCLEKRPERRYAGASELAEDLGRFLEGRPIRARRSTAWERAWKWARRRPVHAALAAVVATIVLGTLGGVAWDRARERRYHDVIREARDQRDLVDRLQTGNQLKVAGSSLIERGDPVAARAILDALGTGRGGPDAHGFAWSYVDGRCRPRIAMLPPLPARVMQLACSKDGRTIALADEAQNIVLVDRVTGQSRVLPGKHRPGSHPGFVFSPDGGCLASLCHRFPSPNGRISSTIKLWDVASGEPIEGMTTEFGHCYEVLFSADGRTLVTVEAAHDNPEAPVRCWNISTERKRVSPGESLRANQLALSLAPARRAAGSGSRPFRLSDVITTITGDDPSTAVWPEKGEIRLHRTSSGYFRALCRVEGPEVVVLPRHDLPVPYSRTELDAIARAACALTGCARARLISQDVPVLWARFSLDGRTAAVMVPYPGRPEGRIRLINVGTGAVVAESPWGDLWLGCQFGFAPDGDALLVGGFDTRARIWDIWDSRRPHTLKGHTEEVWGLAFSPDGSTLASAAGDHTLKLWDVAAGRERATLEGHTSIVRMAAYSPDGALLASSSADQTVRLWDAATNYPLATLEGHTDWVRTLAFSPDGRILASAGRDRTARLWDVAGRRPLTPPLVGHTDGVFSIAFSPDGKTLFTGAGDKTIRLWDVAEGRLRAVWPAGDEVFGVAVSPDGQTIATTHPRGRLSLWEVAQGRARAALSGHVGEVRSVAFSPDGRSLASTGHDRTVRIWDPVTAQEILTLKGHEASVRPVRFSPDGTILATGSEDGVIKLWRASPAPR